MRRLPGFFNLMKVSMSFFMIVSMLSTPIVFAQDLSEIDAEDAGVSTIDVSESGPASEGDNIPSLATESEESIPGSEQEDAQGDTDAGTEPGSVGGEPQPQSDQVEVDDIPEPDVTEVPGPETSGDEQTTPESQDDNLVEPAPADKQVVDDAAPEGEGTLTLTIVFEGEADIIGESCFELSQNDTAVGMTECLAPEGIIDGERTVQFNELPAGTYTVVASVVPDGWIADGPAENVVIAADHEATASITISAAASITTLAEPAATTYQMIIEQRICAEGISGGDCARHDSLADFSINFTITGPGPEDVQTATVTIGGSGTPAFSTGRIYIRNLPAGTYEVCGELVASHGTSTATLISLDGPCQTKAFPTDRGPLEADWHFHSQLDELTSSETGDLWITKYVCANADLAGTAEIVWVQPSNCGPPVTAGFSLDVQRDGESVLPPGHDLLVNPATLEIGTYILLEDGVPVGPFTISVWGRVLTVINYVELATVTVDPASGLAGSLTTVSGTNLLPGEQVSLTFAGQELTTATADGNGTFSVAITIPVTAENGPYQIVAKRPFNRQSGTTTFTVGLPTAVALTVDPAFGQPGSQATVSGTNFQASEEVALTFAGAALTTTTANADGAISMLVTIPLSATAGAHDIVATGLTSGQIGTTSFTVTPVASETGEVNLAKYVCEDESLAGTSGVVATAPENCGAPVSGGYVFDIVDSGGLSVLEAGSDLLAAPVNVSVGTGYQLVEDGIPLGDVFDVTTAGVSFIVVNYVVPSESGPTLELNTTSGPAGVVVGFTGTGFVPGERVDIRFGGANGRLVGYRTASTGGSIGGAITIPSGASVGDHQVVAIGASGRQADATYDVAAPVAATLVLNSTSGPAGVVVGFTGTGFVPGERVDIRFGGSNGRLVGYKSATTSGSISGAVTIPAGTSAGAYQVVAIGASGRQADAIYDVAAPVAATFMLNTTSGPAGVVVGFTGTGFVPGERVDIRFGGANGRLVGYRTASTGGSIGGAITIPSGASVGDHQVVAIGASGRQADATYDVAAPVAATLVLNSTSGPAGVVVGFTGTGFVPGERVDIRFGGSNGRLVGYKSATASGSISGAVTIPAGTSAGAYQVVAVGASGRQAETTYTVRSTAQTMGQDVVGGFDRWSFVWNSRQGDVTPN